MYLFLDCAVGVEDGELVEVDDVLARLRVALGENGHAARDRAACLFDQLLHRTKRFAGRDHVVDDQHALAADLIGLFAGQVQVLIVLGRNGADRHVQRAGHIDL